LSRPFPGSLANHAHQSFEHRHPFFQYLIIASTPSVLTDINLIRHGNGIGIWMSFFDTEEAHAVMLAYAAYGGPVDHRSSGPGSSGKSRLKAPAQFGAKKDIHIPKVSVVQMLGQ